MTAIKTYHRPQDMDEAIGLLTQPGVTTAVLAGGTELNVDKAEAVDAVVDLQALGLEGIEQKGDRLIIRAMTRLQALVESGNTPDLIRETAHREGPNTFRNQGTIGGVIANADSESELLAAMLVSEAEVSVQTQSGVRTLALSAVLADVDGSLADGILTAVSLAIAGQTTSGRVARTPADKPIVAAVGRKKEDGQLLLALCGLADTPILVNPDQIASLDPSADFRGSSEYRKQMATVLSERVVEELN